MDNDINFDTELQGGMKWSYEQFHILSLVLQQKIMVQKGSYPVREAMMDHQWDSIPTKNKEAFVEQWEVAENHIPVYGCSDDDKVVINYQRLRKKAQLISDILLEIKVINYSPPSEAEEIIRLGMEALSNGNKE